MLGLTTLPAVLRDKAKFRLADFGLLSLGRLDIWARRGQSTPMTGLLTIALLMKS
jgi:hypothetical protein